MIAVDSLRVRYPGSDTDAVRSFRLTVAPGEVVVIFGPNGSGKTTGLKALAGILRAERLEASTDSRAFAYVHQDPYMLHRRVSANIAYGAALSGVPRGEVERTVRAVAERCGVTDLLHRRATALSGGERQRVAIARALALGRPVLVLDEPTANLDRESRVLVARLVRAEAATGRAVVVASHDRPFALALGDRFYEMEDGALHPQLMNIVSGVARSDDHGVDAVVTVAGHRMLGRASETVASGSAARAVFRPEDVVLSAEPISSSALNSFAVRVVRTTTREEGGELVYTVPLGDDTITMGAAVSHHSVNEMHLSSGREVWASVKASSVRIFALPENGAAR